MKNFFYIFTSLILVSVASGTEKPFISVSTDNIAIERVRLTSLNMGAWFQNTGIFNQDSRTNNTPGLEWPLNSGKFASFSAGLTISAFINNQLAQVSGSYSGEYVPGIIQNGIGYTNDDFKFYQVKLNDNPNTNSDYANWYKMVPYGAPYHDVNNNGIFDPGIDKPGMKDSYQTIFIALTDGFVSSRNAGEGFGGGVTNPLLLADVRMTAWTYTHQGYGDVQFIEWKIINRSNDRVWENTRIGIFVDANIGSAGNEYAGTDTSLHLGYAYVGTPNDGTGTGNSYGQFPPAYGVKILKGPVDKISNIDQTFSSMINIKNTGSSIVPCEADANGEPMGAYNFLSGFKKDSTPWINPHTGEIVKYLYPGDPESSTGWTEFNGSVQNCNRLLTGNVIPVNAPSQRRLLINNGKNNFTISPGDTQVLLAAQMVQQGYNHKNSVTKLKRYSQAIQMFYENDFNIISSVPTPKVKSSITHLPGDKCEINLLWGDISEYYKYHDTLFFNPQDSNIYEFEGYEIYEVNNTSTTLPNFNVPYTIKTDEIKLVAIYDKRNTIGYVFDTLYTGIGNQYSPLPIVPPFGFGNPENFPNFGLNRSQRITHTNFPDNYGGTSSLQYNQEYKFIVTAYAVSRSTKITRGFKVMRSTLSSGMISVIPRRLGNSEFSFVNWDTLNTNRRDLGVAPVVIGQEYLIDATYRVVYDTPDTTYSILRSTNNGSSFETMKSGLKSFAYSKAQDSSRIIDGVLIDANRINLRGVIRDLTPFAGPDSIRSRFGGWDYITSGTRNLRGAFRFRAGNYQSTSMSLVYPMQGFYTNIGSQITADNLLPVELEFTGQGNGQTAYRYRADTTQALFDNFYLFDQMIEVPFRAYETDYNGNRRQVNVAIVNSYDQNANPRMQFGFNPTADSLGGKVLVYVFKSDYNSEPDPFYTTKNLFLSVQVDVSYVWAPRLITAGSPAYTAGDKLTIYPYMMTKPGVSYEFKTVAPFLDFDTTSQNNPIVPLTYYLSQNYPNPFNPTTKIRFTIPEPAVLCLKVYNVLGQLVRTVINETMYQPGETIIDFNGSGLSSGVYFYVLQSKNFFESKKMVLIR